MRFHDTCMVSHFVIFDMLVLWYTWYAMTCHMIVVMLCFLMIFTLFCAMAPPTCNMYLHLAPKKNVWTAIGHAGILPPHSRTEETLQPERAGSHLLYELACRLLGSQGGKHTMKRQANLICTHMHIHVSGCARRRVAVNTQCVKSRCVACAGRSVARSVNA